MTYTVKNYTGGVEIETHSFDNHIGAAEYLLRNAFDYKRWELRPGITGRGWELWGYSEYYKDWKNLRLLGFFSNLSDKDGAWNEIAERVLYQNDNVYHEFNVIFPWQQTNDKEN